MALSICGKSLTPDVKVKGRFHDPTRSSDVQTLVEFCDSHPDFALPSASHLVIPTRYHGGECIRSGSLHDIALRAILVAQCHWYQTFTATQSQSADGKRSIMSFGLERCVPPSYMRNASLRVVHIVMSRDNDVIKSSRIYCDTFQLA